jgi:hypothetical protein
MRPAFISVAKQKLESGFIPAIHKQGRRAAMADGRIGGRTRQAPFRQGEAVACADCGAAHWHVGRRSAECASCGGTLPLAGGEPVGAAAARLRKGAKGRFRPARNG